MGTLIILILTPIRAGTSRADKKFNWDVENLEEVFCERSRSGFDLSSEITSRENSAQFLSSVGNAIKKTKAGVLMKWLYGNDFEMHCIEEECADTEMQQFCKKLDGDISSNELKREIAKQRSERLQYCKIHIEKRINTTKLINSNKNTTSPFEGADLKIMLSPDYIFRGWWQDLRKAYKRFCLQDVTDCARKCNTSHGTCNLWEDKDTLDENGLSQWKYRCQCDPGYGPSYEKTPDTESYSKQYLCSAAIEQTNTGTCNTLSDTYGAITPAVLNDVVHGPKTHRNKRMVGGYSVFADNYYFPAAVDIFYSTIPLHSSQGTYIKDNPQSYGHRCGGTLVHLNSGSTHMSDRVVTAAHCFCEFQLLPEHFFVRIGLLDNKEALNFIMPGQHVVKPGETDRYVDVNVKNIILNTDDYMDFCLDTSIYGENDVAVLELVGLLDLSTLSHVKPSCNYGKQFTDDEYKNKDKRLYTSGYNRCFTSGWGKSELESNELSISRRLKFAEVKILWPYICQDAMPADVFLKNMAADQNGHYPIICAEGFNDEYKMSNTCGGDSGAGLFCFDEENDEKYYFMGVLHGGSQNCWADSLMYFSNNRYTGYSKLLSFQND